jgi:hypothetical protein
MPGHFTHIYTARRVAKEIAAVVKLVGDLIRTDLPLVTLGATVDGAFKRALSDAIDPFGDLDRNQGSSSRTRCATGTTPTTRCCSSTRTARNPMTGSCIGRGPTRRSASSSRRAATPPARASRVYRVTASQRGEVFGGYTVALLG